MDNPKVTHYLAALHDGDSLLCAQSALELGRMADDSAVPALIAALKDEFRDVRLNAVYSLGHIGNVSAFLPSQK